jgi:hypothetical protein
MRIKHLLILFVLLAGFTSAQTEYPLVTIQDIQYVPDSLRHTDPKSPLDGDTVRVQGLVLVAPVIDPINNKRDIISAGARWATYIQDPEGNLWGGLNIIQDDTTGLHANTFFNMIDTAQIVEFTGRIMEYNTTTEMVLIHAPEPIPVEIIGANPKRPDPIELTLSDLFTSSGTYNFDAEKYEGMYVIFRNIISSDRNTNGNFKINDGNGKYAFIYNQSRYFKTGTAGIIPEYQPPQDGSYLAYLRGIVTTRVDGYYIVPVYPGDIGPVLQSPPLISSIRRNIPLVSGNEPVEISANIKDIDGYVSSATLCYRVNGGDRIEVAMSKTEADSLIMTATIPGVPDSALVDYYIKSVDNVGNQSIVPADTTTANYFYLVLNRPVTIKDVQYSPFGSGYSAYNNQRISVSGVITADAKDLPGFGSTPLRVYMQDGVGAWSGLQIGTLGAMGADVLELKRGDHVTVSGLIMESYNVTKIDSLTAITVNSSGNALPEFTKVTTGEMGLGGGTLVSRECWESVLIKFEDVNVDSTNADGSGNFGEILVNDGTGATRVELQDGCHNYGNGAEDTDTIMVVVSKGDKFAAMQGVMYFSFSNYKLAPRTNSDFVGYAAVNVKEKTSAPVAYQLNQNYPNPFNPSTVISYSVPREGLVKLKIYNLLGQEVMTLVNQNQSAGLHKVSFNASKFNSGVYFYSLETDNFKSVKKMMLLK